MPAVLGRTKAARAPTLKGENWKSLEEERKAGLYCDPGAYARRKESEVCSGLGWATDGEEQARGGCATSMAIVSDMSGERHQTRRPCCGFPRRAGRVRVRWVMGHAGVVAYLVCAVAWPPPKREGSWGLS